MGIVISMEMDLVVIRGLSLSSSTLNIKKDLLDDIKHAVVLLLQGP